MASTDIQRVIKPMPGFTFGCDPELFVFDREGLPVPAGKFIPGTKEEPYKVPFGAVQRDGLAAEFNIDPVETFQEWDHHITRVVAELQKFLPSGFTLGSVPSVTFPEETWEAVSPSDKELGCTPDFNAWTGEVNPPPDVGDSRTRCAGGHIHYGWVEGADISDEKHVANCRDLVKQLDWYVGTWSVRQDEDDTRRKMYGKAGACRYKEYGVEYRTLSNFWISSKTRRLMVWNRMQAAIWGMRDNYMPESKQYAFAPEAGNVLVIDMINSSKRNKQMETAYRFPIWDVDHRHVEKGFG